MKLEMIIGKETCLVIDDVVRSINEHGILGNGYQKAVDAFHNYIQQTERLRIRLKKRGATDSEINNMLYRSPQNIIAFCGKRGTGKTSAMLSFAEFLERDDGPGSASYEFKKQNFSNMRSVVLSPLDPTMLENDQDLLSVVLSRLLYKAEERWNHNTSFRHSYEDLETEKNQLLRMANACMNGIQAVKKKKEISSLADLQRIGDSAVLKKNLFDLVEKVNSFCLNKVDADGSTDYLVIPIDDTDCQIQKAHAVMEDIRRYLTLPNVIILMAMDSDMLRNVFAQHYADAFNTGLNKSFLEPREMQHYAEKYMTKLVPATHRVYLPVFENIIRSKTDTLELRYYETDDRDKDQISGTCEKARNELDKDFQAKILTYIFKKTRIVFVAHVDYVNNIIPTTMRGLAHLLNYLYSMGDLETIDYSTDLSPEKLLKKAGKLLEVLEKNLDLFEEYFMNEWVPAKVPGKMAKILRGIEEQVPSNTIQYAFDEIYRMYFEDNKRTDEYHHVPVATYYDLMEMLGEINGTVYSVSVRKSFKNTVDFYNTFAVRTLLTIKNNRQSVTLRRRKLEEWAESLCNHTNDPLIFDFFSSKNENSFPDSDQQVAEKKKSSIEKTNEIDKNRDHYQRNLKPVLDLFRQALSGMEDLKKLLMDTETEIDQVDQGTKTKEKEKNISESSAPGNHEPEESSGKPTISEKPMDILRMQELARIALCNWDVQDVIYKAVEEYKSRADKPKSAGELWEEILKAISEKNRKMLEKYTVNIDNPDSSRLKDLENVLIKGIISDNSGQQSGNTTEGNGEEKPANPEDYKNEINRRIGMIKEKIGTEQPLLRLTTSNIEEIVDYLTSWNKALGDSSAKTEKKPEMDTAHEILKNLIADTRSLLSEADNHEEAETQASSERQAGVSPDNLETTKEKIKKWLDEVEKEINKMPDLSDTNNE